MVRGEEKCRLFGSVGGGTAGQVAGGRCGLETDGRKGSGATGIGRGRKGWLKRNLGLENNGINRGEAGPLQ